MTLNRTDIGVHRPRLSPGDCNQFGHDSGLTLDRRHDCIGPGVADDGAGDLRHRRRGFGLTADPAGTVPHPRMKDLNQMLRCRTATARPWRSTRIRSGQPTSERRTPQVPLGRPGEMGTYFLRPNGRTAQATSAPMPTAMTFGSMSRRRQCPSAKMAWVSSAPAITSSRTKAACQNGRWRSATKPSAASAP